MSAGYVTDVARAYARFGMANAELFDALAARALVVLDDYETDGMLR
jgi:hypothetical protein